MVCACVDVDQRHAVVDCLRMVMSLNLSLHCLHKSLLHSLITIKCGAVNILSPSHKHSLTHPLTHHPLTHSLTHPPTHSPTPSPPTHPLTHPLIHPLTHLLTHPLTHPLTHSPLTHSLQEIDRNLKSELDRMSQLAENATISSKMKKLATSQEKKHKSHTVVEMASTNIKMVSCVRQNHIIYIHTIRTCMCTYNYIQYVHMHIRTSY